MKKTAITSAKNLRTGLMSLREDGIIEFVTHKGAYMELEDSEECREWGIKLAEEAGYKHPLLVDMRKLGGASKQARKDFASDNPRNQINSCAAVISSGISKLIGNFLLGFNKPPFPVRLFTNKEEAVEWLKQFRGA